MLDRLIDRLLMTSIPDERFRDRKVLTITKGMALACIAILVVIAALPRQPAAEAAYSTQKDIDESVGEIREAYAAMTKALSENDPEGLAHYITERTGPGSSVRHIPLRDDILKLAESGESIAPFFMHDDDSPNYSYVPVSPNNNPIQVMKVTWKSEDSAKYFTREDEWHRENDEWRLYASRVTETISKSAVAAAVDQAYWEIEHVQSDNQISAICSYWSKDYKFISKSGVVISAREARDNVLSLLHRTRLSDRMIHYGVRQFQPDRSFRVERTYTARNGDIAATVFFEDTWVPEGSNGARKGLPWKLLRTVARGTTIERTVRPVPSPPPAVSSSTASNQDERSMRSDVSAAYGEFDSAVNQHDVDRFVGCLSDDHETVDEQGGKINRDELRNEMVEAMRSGDTPQISTSLEVFTPGKLLQAVTIVKTAVRYPGDEREAWFADIWNRSSGRWLLKHRQVVDTPPSTPPAGIPPWISVLLRQKDIDGKGAPEIQKMIGDLYGEAGSVDNFTTIQAANFNVLVARRAMLRGK